MKFMGVLKCLTMKTNINYYIKYFLHVMREDNQAANFLVNYVYYNLDCIWNEETPPCISAALTFDFLSDIR